jgi:hypothetical protein
LLKTAAAATLPAEVSEYFMSYLRCREPRQMEIGGLRRDERHLLALLSGLVPSEKIPEEFLSKFIKMQLGCHYYEIVFNRPNGRRISNSISADNSIFCCGDYIYSC